MTNHCKYTSSRPRSFAGIDRDQCRIRSSQTEPGSRGMNLLYRRRRRLVRGSRGSRGSRKPPERRARIGTWFRVATASWCIRRPGARSEARWEREGWNLYHTFPKTWKTKKKHVRAADWSGNSEQWALTFCQNVLYLYRRAWAIEDMMGASDSLCFAANSRVRLHVTEP